MDQAEHGIIIIGMEGGGGGGGGGGGNYIVLPFRKAYKFLKMFFCSQKSTHDHKLFPHGYAFSYMHAARPHLLLSKYQRQISDGFQRELEEWPGF